ncbi:MAG TPA: c-type cytochrome [Thermoanaerobaculia bacterium]|nr:c-type cytochrome [Thermoanaerobaculia bacterium]
MRAVACLALILWSGGLQAAGVDVSSWETFLTLNKKLPSGLRVWETWKETSQVYLPDGRKPLPWNDSPGRKILFRTEKVDDVLDDVIQPTGADGTLPITLTDRNRKAVRFEIRMNRPAFEYVVRNKLYDSHQQAKAKTIDFPDGSMLIKAAWRELEADEVPQYISTRADVCDKKLEHCVRRTMGLVGFHIMHKTKSAPQWLWSTFEQKDNVDGTHPSFFDPACTDCTVNRQTFPGVRNQVVRVVPLTAEVIALNQQYEAKLSAPLNNYFLVATQWPTSSGTPPTVFTVTPPLLANTTLETFIQPTSSCMGCHAMARTVRQTSFVSSDFTFTLNNAKPTLKPLPPFVPLHPKSFGVKRAKELTLNTYEMVTPPFVMSKLHCGSCHLDAGTNMRAAWWVGSSDRYSPRPKLFARINQCFENSMNGKAICGSDDACGRNADMMALVEYIDDLTKKWNQEHPKTAAPCGFPKITTLTGDATSGKAIFQQKCAFCHGADGQGRYESGTYYRPALWGDRSFNTHAGMAKQVTIAEFVHANMPFGSGGELTAQESWDLAAFIDTQSRPTGGTSGSGSSPQCPSPPQP